MRRTLVLVGLVCLCIFFATSLLAREPMKAPGKDVIWAAPDIKWEPGPAPGIHVATLWGDWKKGAFGVLVKFDPGFVNPMHHHSHDLKLIVISGTFVHTPEGGTPVMLPPGSYFMQAANTKHTSGCSGSEGCEFFMSGDKAFDSIPAK